MTAATPPVLSLSLLTSLPSVQEGQSASTAAPQSGGDGTGAGATEPRPGLFDSMWFPVLMMVGIFWLIVIGPERKQRKKREAMLSSLEKGQKVLTTSGIFGHVAQIQDQVVTVQVAEGVRMRFARHAIQTVVDTDAAEAKDEKKDK